MQYTTHTNIISVDDLAKSLQNNTIKLLDATLPLPEKQNKAYDNFLAEHIQNAQYFNMDIIADQSSQFAHTLPSPETFSTMVSKLGVSDNDDIIVYDQYGMFSAARGWWMFKIMGAHNVRVLDGGLPAWIAAGYAVESTHNTPKHASFKARFQPNMVKSIQEVYTAMQRKEQIVDARSQERFNGNTHNPYDGHIPNSLNLQYNTLLNNTHNFLPKNILKEKILQTGIRFDHHVITTCGSGVTACILALALDEVGHKNYSVYDGSWIEWMSQRDSQNDFPIHKKI